MTFYNGVSPMKNKILIILIFLLTLIHSGCDFTEEKLDISGSITTTQSSNAPVFIAIAKAQNLDEVILILENTLKL